MVLSRLLGIAALALAVFARAEGADLFEGHAIVSGTGPASREEALPLALREVLVKVSGDPALAGDPWVAAIDAAALLEDDVFLDRMTDMPHHDEQGTRDRPWDYVAHFDPAGIRAALAGLGSSAWDGPRPHLAARIAVHDQDGGSYPLNNDSDDGERLRQALLAAARRFRHAGCPAATAATGSAPARHRRPARHAALERGRSGLGRCVDPFLAGARPCLADRRRLVRRGVAGRRGRRDGGAGRPALSAGRRRSRPGQARVGGFGPPAGCAYTAWPACDTA